MKNHSLTSPCHDRSPIDGKHSLCELPLSGKLNIRGNAGDPDFCGAVKEHLGLDLPIVPNTISEGDSSSLFWLGPDEWMLRCDLENLGAIADKLRTGLSELHCAVTEVSDYYTVLRLSGPDSELLVRNGCPLDIHHSVFKTGQIAQTRFGHASILLHKQDAITWDMQVRWSYAQYIWDYIVSGISTIRTAPAG